jgi:CubicO group peptidase (beta-lactamase class C family)
LEFSDGKSHYSNLGFHFLSLVIEQKAGKPYAKALKERIFAPVGVTRARITSSTTDLADGEVIALDRHLRVGRSTMEKARPIVPHEYGTLNRDIRPGSGGWSMSAPDYVRFLSVLHSGSGTLLDKTTVDSDDRIRKHGGSADGAVAHIEHMAAKNVTFAAFFSINFFGDFEQRIKDIINVLPDSAWPLVDLFPDFLS